MHDYKDIRGRVRPGAVFGNARVEGKARLKGFRTTHGWKC